MLHFITWMQFFVAILTVATTYYAITVLLLYGEDIKSFIRNRPTPTKPHAVTRKDHAVMGVIRDESTLQTSESASEIRVGDEEQAEAPDLLVGAIADLLEEIKSLIGGLSRDGKNKEDVVNFFRVLLSRYPQLATTSHRDSIAQFIHDHANGKFPFELTMSEIKSWWKSDSQAEQIS